MIHIDDLIRQRLNGEEEERAGAWLHMRDLLDKTMPTNPVRAARWNWRKTALSVAAIAGICALGIGSYEMYSSYRGPGGNGSSAEATTTGGGSTALAEAQPANPGTEAQPGEPAAPATATEADNTAPNTTAPIATGNNSPVATTATNTPASPKANGRANRSRRSGNQQAVTTTGNATPVLASNSATTVNTSAANSTPNNNVQQPLDNTTSSAPNNTSPAPGNLNQKNNTGSNPTAGDPTPANNRMNKVPGRDPQADAETRTIPTLQENRKLSVDARTGTAQVESTINQGPDIQVPVDRPIASTTQPVPPVVPQAFIGPVEDTEPTGNYAMIPASGGGGNTASGGHKGQGKAKFNMFGWVDQLIESVSQYQFGKVGVNTGVVVGGNTSVGKYNLYGFQGGFFADVIFHEKWSLRAEARYTHRFNKITNVYSDNFISYTPSGSMYSKETNEHYFKYSTVSGVEMPIMLQYNYNNFFVLGGVNLSYFFHTQTEEISRKTAIGMVSQIEESRVPLTVNDFSARFGGGYAVGVGYRINMVTLDARMTHNVWDNTKTQGAQQISRDIFFKPNFQFNVSYRFGKDKRSNELTPGGN